MKLPALIIICKSILLPSPLPRCVLRGVHGPAGDQPDRDRIDRASGPQTGPAAPRPTLAEVPDPGAGPRAVLHPQEVPPLLQSDLTAPRPGALQGEQLRHR